MDKDIITEEVNAEYLKGFIHIHKLLCSYFLYSALVR